MQLCGNASGDEATLRYLVDRGADVNQTTKAKGYTPLILAARANRTEAAKFLLELSEVDPNIICKVRTEDVV
jgi:ankyrin repeat protein